MLSVEILKIRGICLRLLEQMTWEYLEAVPIVQWMSSQPSVFANVPARFVGSIVGKFEIVRSYERFWSFRHRKTIPLPRDGQIV